MGTQFGGRGGDGGGGYGAGIYVNHLASLNVSNSLFASNVAQSSGGGNGGTITPTGIPGTGGAGVNSEGGAIWNAGTLVVRNSTLDGNSVKGGSQGLGFVNTCGQSRGGGLYTSLNSSLINVTVTQNQAIPEFVICSVSGLGGGVFGAGGTTQFGNTIIADNIGSVGVPSAPDVSGTFMSLGNNLVENTTGGTINGNTSGNITGQDPQLGSLQYQGGVASIRSPNTGSPVINAGNNTLAANANLTMDQRATCFRRIVGSAVDMGAFEVQVTSSLVCNNFDYDGDGRTDMSVFRPADGYWYVRRSTGGATDSIPFGQQGDVLAPADFDGDGKTDSRSFGAGIGIELTALSVNSWRRSGAQSSTILSQAITTAMAWLTSRSFAKGLGIFCKAETAIWRCNLEAAATARFPETTTATASTTWRFTETVFGTYSKAATDFARRSSVLRPTGRLRLTSTAMEKPISRFFARASGTCFKVRTGLPAYSSDLRETCQSRVITTAMAKRTSRYFAKAGGTCWRAGRGLQDCATDCRAICRRRRRSCLSVIFVSVSYV